MIANIGKRLVRLLAFNAYSYIKPPQYISALPPKVILSEDPKPRKRTKTVCTIGPKTQSPQNAGKLLDEGLSVARLNFSHGDHEEHRKQMEGVQQALKSRPHRHASILLDTKGPQIRTGETADGKPIQVHTGQKLEITTDYSFLGTSKRIACSYPDLHNSTEVGKRILIADGAISAKVTKIKRGIVTVEVLNDGKIGSRKNMCLPGCAVNLPTITKKDEIDIIDFGLRYKVNYIAVSFARYKKDLDDLRKLLIQKDPVYGPYIQLISKIQNHEAIYNLEEIIDGSDGIMVARGDLGMEVPIEKVTLLQKYIKQKTINRGKTVITATQMLESMEVKPLPTRAQVSDITNAIIDMTDANMTSGETTNGQFPTECCRILKKIAQQTESVCNYKRVFENRKSFIDDPECIGPISLAFELSCDFIFIETDDIRLVNRLSSLRPRAYLAVFTDKPEVKGALAINFGVYCYPTGKDQDPRYFIEKHGQRYGIEKKKAKVLTLSTENGKIRSSRYDQIN